MSDARGWWRVSCGLCVWQDLGQGAGRDELTHAEHHQSSSKVISITGAHLLHESHPIHHRYCLDVTLPARAWPLSPKSPWCAVQQLRRAGRGSVLSPDSLPPLTSRELLPFIPLASQSLDKPVPSQSQCSLCCGRVAREGRKDGQEMMSLALLAPCCRQVLCPPSPPWSHPAEEAVLRTCYEKLLQGPAKPPGLNAQAGADTPLGTQMWSRGVVWCSDTKCGPF